MAITSYVCTSIRKQTACAGIYIFLNVLPYIHRLHENIPLYFVNKLIRHVDVKIQHVHVIKWPNNILYNNSLYSYLQRPILKLIQTDSHQNNTHQLVAQIKRSPTTQLPTIIHVIVIKEIHSIYKTTRGATIKREQGKNLFIRSL